MAGVLSSFFQPGTDHVVRDFSIIQPVTPTVAHDGKTHLLQPLRGRKGD